MSKVMSMAHRRREFATQRWMLPDKVAFTVSFLDADVREQT